jgi:threonine dehydrogenase-like Zn-dependent dehydrogenase
VGDHVAVFGMGTIGLLAVQLARMAGAAKVVAVDPLDRRRSLAIACGADEAVDPVAFDPVAEHLRTRPWARSTGLDGALECSASYGALQAAIASVGLAGLVVTVSWYPGGGGDLDLGREWLINRPTLVSSMSAWGCPHRSHPKWDRHRVRETALGLMGEGRLEVAPLVSHVIPFDEASRAYRLIDERPEDVVKVVFSYGRDPEEAV